MGNILTMLGMAIIMILQALAQLLFKIMSFPIRAIKKLIEKGG
jgi:hypothetical protein